MQIQMDPGNKDSKTAVEFICKLTKKRETDLRLKELVKIVENILKGTVNNDIIVVLGVRLPKMSRATAHHC